jgi:hypothetical protein
MGSEQVDVGGIVVSDDHRVIADPNIPIQSREKVRGQMSGVPVLKGLANPLPELMNDRLSEQGHGHVPIADVQIESAGPPPTQVLIKLEELLDVPALGGTQR